MQLQTAPAAEAAGTLLPNPNGRIPTSFYDRDENFDKFKRTEASVGYEFVHRFNDLLTVRQNFRYLHADLDEDLIGSIGLESDLRTLDRYAFRADASVDTVAVDNQARFTFGTDPVRHTTLVGVDYLHSVDRWAEYDAASVAPIDVYAPVYGISVALPAAPDYSVRHPLDQVGVYLQDQIRFDHWVATLSGGQDWSTTKEIDRLSGTTTQNNDSDKFTYRAGLVYLFDDGLAPYLSYSTSFQPGLGATFDGHALKPTTGRSAEVGIKYQPSANSFVMLSAYDTRQNNVVEPDPAHPQGNFSTQVGERHVRGVELSGTADLGAGLDVTAAYTYMDGTVNDANVGISDNRAAGVPRNAASLWLDKTFQTGLLSGFGLGGGVRYTGARYGDEANQFSLPSNTLADAAIHYTLPHWRFSVNAQNLFDRIYVGGCQRANYCSYGLRRTILGRVTYRW